MKQFFTLILLSTLLFDQNISAQNQIDISEQVRNYTSEGRNYNDYSEFSISNYHQSNRSGAYHYYLQQQIYGLDIYNGVMSLHFDQNGIRKKVNDQFYDNIQDRISNSTLNEKILTHMEILQSISEEIGFTLDEELILLESEQTVERKMIFAGGNISQESIPFKLVFVFTPQNEFRLCWDLNILTFDTGDWWSLKVDALTGQIVDKLNWTVSCNFGHQHDKKCGKQLFMPDVNSNSEASDFEMASSGESYRVYPLGVESPIHGDRELVVAPYHPTASPYGWHDTNGITGPEYTYSRGNNVWAQEDQDGNNGTGVSAEGGANLNFDFPIDYNLPPSANINAALTNLFYWNNVMHDVWYQYGFTESAGNFQQNNYSNGGTGNDYVLADGLDGSGSNNANFSTPVDGSRPRMQMFLWSAPTSTLTFTVTSPSVIAGNYTGAKANFGPGIYNINGELVLADPVLACSDLTNASSVSGKIAVIDRGTCEFGAKCLRAQNAGAIAVIICNNVTGSPISMSPGAQGANVTIPSIMLSLANCNTIKVHINNGVQITMVGAGGIQIDGDFDNGIIVHEYGHGISNRLTGGPANSNCLGNQEQMGEGWSDWFGLMLTIKPGDIGTTGRGIGTYALGQPPTGTGIRTYRYSTDMTINPHTYNSVISLAAPHGVGSVWCAMLWELTWDLIDAYGYDSDLYTGVGGNNIAMALVTEALKLQPCSPGFVDGRNAILAADDLLYNGIHKCLIWKAFAKRGLGFSANQGSTSSKTDGTEAFDMPIACCKECFNNKNSETGSLRAAVNCVSPGDTITFAPFMANKIITLIGGLVINKDLCIDGISTDYVTITTNDLSTPLVITNNTVSLHNLNFIPVNNSQAKVILNNGNLTLHNITMADNIATNTPTLLNNGTVNISGITNIK